MSLTVQHLDELLQKSAASQDFKNAVDAVQNGQSSPLLSFNKGIPSVKALRAVSKLLEQEPGLIIQQVEINATSGCSDFVGTLTVNGGEVEFDFDWDCAWRAKEQKYEDHFGYPDQIRAAREFGYQCFKKFKRVN